MTAELLLALWELVWAGLVTNDTFAPLRLLLGGSRARPGANRRRRRGPACPARLGPPAGAGRWSLVPERSTDTTRRAHALAEQLLERHGILTRARCASERVPGGFAGVYPVLKAMEESGRCRRGYFVDGLGGAQFALAGAVDRMRSLVHDDGTTTVVLAATDPANPYGAALPWPEREGGRTSNGSTKKVAALGRKAGAVVVLVDGRLVLYVEKGGRTMLSYSDDDAVLRPAIDALVLAREGGAIGQARGREGRRRGRLGHPARRDSRRCGAAADVPRSPAACLRATPCGWRATTFIGPWRDTKLVRTDFRVPRYATTDLGAGDRARHRLPREASVVAHRGRPDSPYPLQDGRRVAPLPGGERWRSPCLRGPCGARDRGLAGGGLPHAGPRPDRNRTRGASW